MTFFFCLPPPDFAGFEDGGGALSFFGAYKTTQIKKQNVKQLINQMGN